MIRLAEDGYRYRDEFGIRGDALRCLGRICERRNGSPSISFFDSG